jgi:hypothetical protein
VTQRIAEFVNKAVDRDSLQAEVDRCDWESASADTRFMTHDLHRYSSKFIPQIASQAIGLLSAPGEVVLDPMMGSGTTLIEAWRGSRRVIGMDLNPLAVLIARVKTRRVSTVALDEAADHLFAVVAGLEARSEGQLTIQGEATLKEAELLARRDSRRTDPWFRKWFQPHVLDDLLTIDAAIGQLPDERARNLSRLALSETLRRASNAHAGFPNVMFDRSAPHKPSPAAGFGRNLAGFIEKVRQLDQMDGAEPSISLGDARETRLESESIDAVVTHPPYVGSVPYAEYGLVSLKWLGVDDKTLDSELLGGRRQSRAVLERFEAMYLEVLKEAHRLLRPGRGMFLMVGDPVVRGELVDLAALTRKLARAVGFGETASAIRQGRNRRANKMKHETLLFFQKQP